MAKKLIAVHLIYAGKPGDDPTQPGGLFTVETVEEAAKLIAAGAAKEPTEETETAAKTKAKAEADAKARAAAEAKAKAKADADAKAKAKADAEEKAREEGARKNAFLLGSSLQPPLINIRGADVQLGTVVAAAHEFSKLSVEEWNALAEDERERLIADQITRMELEGQ